MNEIKFLIFPSNSNPSGDLFLGANFLKDNRIKLCGPPATASKLPPPNPTSLNDNPDC